MTGQSKLRNPHIISDLIAQLYYKTIIPLQDRLIVRQKINLLDRAGKTVTPLDYSSLVVRIKGFTRILFGTEFLVRLGLLFFFVLEIKDEKGLYYIGNNPSSKETRNGKYSTIAEGIV